MFCYVHLFVILGNAVCTNNWVRLHGIHQSGCYHSLNSFGNDIVNYNYLSFQVFPLIALILLCAAVGVNNSSDAKDLPETVTNCTVNVQALDGVFLRKSINIFGGIYIAVCCIAVVYQGIVLVLKSLDVKVFESSWRCFCTIVSQLANHEYINFNDY